MNRIIFSFLIVLSVNISTAQNWSEIAKTLPDSLHQLIIDNEFGASVAIQNDIAVIGARGYDYDRGIVYIMQKSDNTWENIAQLKAPDADENDAFGQSVSISGNNIIVGASGDDELYGQGGSAYIFNFNGTEWQFKQKLTPSTPKSYEYFGHSVSINNETIVVGTNDIGTGSIRYGSAYVFRYNGTDWLETTVLTASDKADDDLFGYSVSISGDKLVVGAYKEESSYDDDTGAAYIYHFNGTNWIEEKKLTILNSGDNDHFGIAVHMVNDRIIIGAERNINNNSATGAAYIFDYDGTNWIQTDKLIPGDNENYSYFGCSVCISGSKVAIGAHGLDDNGLSSGAVYIFQYNGINWIQKAKLTASEGNMSDFLGYSVSISDSVVISGAYKNNSSGSAYIYNEPAAGWVDTIETTRIYPTLFGSHKNNFGWSVSADGTRAVIGAKGYSALQGIAYVYEYNGEIWEQSAILDINEGEDRDFFGYSVSISGDYILIGAFQDDEAGNNSGAAYVYFFDGNSWIYKEKLIAPDLIESERFGYSVCVYEDKFIIGARNGTGNGVHDGCVYVYNLVNDSLMYNSKLLPTNGDDYNYFGGSIGAFGDNIIVGAPHSDAFGSSSGSAYVFNYNGTDWNQTEKLTASDADDYEYFGETVSIFDNYIVIGANGNDENGSNAGAAYIFEYDGTNWAETQKLTASDGVSSDYFGSSVSIYEDVIAIGSTHDDDNGISSGSVYIYSYDGINWLQVQKLIASDGDEFEYFGNSVYISKNNLVIGAYNDDDSGPEAGSAYLYRDCIETISNISEIVCDTFISPSGKIWDTSGTYQDTIYSTLFCDSIITVNLTTGVVDVSVTESNGILSANATGVDYQWLNCSLAQVEIFGAINQSFQPDESGLYAVEITDGTCCDTSTCQAVIISTVTDVSSETVQIYPNPSTKWIKIVAEKLEHIEIYSYNGVLLKRSAESKTNLSNLSNGIYYLKIKYNDKVTTRKLVHLGSN